MRDKSRPGLYTRGDHWHVAIYPKKGSGTKPFRRSLETKEHSLAAEWYDANAPKIREEFWRVAKGQKLDRYWEEAAAIYVEESKRINWGPDAQRLKWVNSKLNGKRLTEISREFWKVVTEVRKAELLEAGKSCSGASLNRYTALVAAVMNKAARQLHWLQVVPLFYYYEEGEARDRVLTKAEAGMVFQAMPDWARDAFLFALSTGLRRGNVIGLRWEWVDMPARVVRVPREAFKQRKRHIQAMNQTAVEIVRKQLGKHDAFVFQKDGQPITKDMMRRAWDAARKALAEDAQFRDLRRTWATWSAENGLTLDDVQRLGGWTSTEMLKRVYAKPSTGFLVGQSEGLDHILHTIPMKDGTSGS